MPHHFTVSPVSSQCLGVYGHIRARFRLRRAPSLRFTSTWRIPLVCQIPPTVLAWSICAMMHGLAILLPESVIVQSPLRLSACAHMHINTRIGMRPGSDARLAAARGLGRYSRWTRYQHVFGSYCRTSAPRGVGSYSDFQVRGKLG